MRMIVLAVGLMATPAMAADQFDLVCTGDDEPWHYRIDLTKGEWCTAKCETTFKLAGVTSGTITIQDEEAGFRGDDTLKNTVNRFSGEWYFYRAMPSIGFNKTVKGKCESGPFSGLAMTTRKF